MSILATPWLTPTVVIVFLAGFVIGAAAIAGFGVAILERLYPIVDEDDDYEEEEGSDEAALLRSQIVAMEQAQEIREQTWASERAMFVEALRSTER